MKRLIFEPEHEQFRETVRAFISREIEPYSQEWEAAGQVDRDVYRKAGEAGLLGFNVPEEFGGGGVEDFRFNVVVAEELARSSHAAPARGPTSRASPVTCVDSPGGSAHLRASASPPWVAVACRHRASCSAAVRCPDTTHMGTPSRWAWASASE